MLTYDIVVYFFFLKVVFINPKKKINFSCVFDGELLTIRSGTTTECHEWKPRVQFFPRNLKTAFSECFAEKNYWLICDEFFFFSPNLSLCFF
jgi:hypothetical protein